MNFTFDVSGHTIDEVAAYAMDHISQVPQILLAEVNGKARKKLVSLLMMDLMVQIEEGRKAILKLDALREAADNNAFLSLRNALQDGTDSHQRAEWVLEQTDIVDMFDRKINAIKEVRARTHLGLKEAKEAVEDAIHLQRSGYMTKAERAKVELESAAAIASIEQTMMALHEGAQRAGVQLS